MMRALLLLGLLACANLFPAEAAAQRRVALVIGNSNYVNVRALANPENDANAIAGLLRAAKFDVVDANTNLGGLEMRRVFRDFAEKSRNADIAVVYYAGHGIEIDGTNYLLPVDTVLKRDIDVEDEAISLDRVVRTLEPAKRLRLIILDACRDNPFVRTVRRTVETRSIGRGLAKIEPMSSDTLIAYAAKAGSTAADGDGKHSPFTVGLLKNLTTPGLDLRIALGRVRDDVMEATGNGQEPFVYGSLGGSTVTLMPDPKPAVAATPARPQAQPQMDSRADIRRDYELALQVGTKETWDAFLAVHGSGFYADLARGQRAKLLAEEARLSPRSTPAAPQPQASPSPAAPPTNLAALAPTATPEPAKSEPDVAETTRQLHAELQRLGCYPGTVTAPWGQNSRRAIELFNKNASANLDTKVASLDALSVVRAKTGRVCPLECKHGFRADNDACVKIVCGAGMIVGKSNECEPARAKSKAASRPTQPAAGSSSGSTPRRQAGEAPPAKIVCGDNGCLNVGKGCRSELRPSGRGGEIAVVLCGGQ
jgi:peptidoglycan hydrolase-like protein with peptidoglycan-binding domain